MKTIAALMTILALSNSASTQSLDYLSRDSFYKNYKKLDSRKDLLVHLPVSVDPMVNEEFDYQDRQALLGPLVGALNAYLDSLGWTSRLAPTALPESGAPYVFVGSSEALTAPPGSEMMREEYYKFPPMVIYLKKASKSWKADFERAMTEQDATLALEIRVGFVEYPKANKGLFEKKVVLGTEYERTIRFLSAEDKPVEVLQLTGILLNRRGDVVRAGAEGIVHEDTPFWAQAFDIQKGVDDQALSAVLTDFRRDDLSGSPLAWQVALETLVTQLVKVVGS